MNISDYKTLYHTLCDTVASYPDRAAYCVPPMKGRSYHPDGWEITWGQVLEGVEAKKNVYAKAGVGHGHRVAILFEQRPEFFFHYYALNALGAGIVPINPDYRIEEIKYVIEHSEATLAVCVDARLAELVSIANSISTNLEVVSFDSFPDELPLMPAAPRHDEPDADTEAALLYTSGTTGRPKGCILTNEYFHTFGESYFYAGGRLGFREEGERLYNPLPLHHANCLSISTPAMLMSGGCVIFPDRFHASTWWKDLVATKATAVQFQGIIPNILLKLPEEPEERQHQVRFALCAGIEPSHHEVFEKRFGFPVVEMWAMSETGRIITDNFEPRKIQTRSFGKESQWVEARVFDENDNELSPGNPGELVIRSNGAEPRQGFFSGYLKNEEATEEAWKNGWFHTGDAVIQDEEGFFYFLDRKKNIIRRSGENIAAAEVEACLTAHERVKQVAVIAAPDEVREEEVMACVVAKFPEDVNGAEGQAKFANELFDWCYERIAYFKAPGWVLFMDTLPLGTSAKVQKIHIFPPGIDPRQQDGSIDLRSRKKQKMQTA
ncbi:MAG: AMP-binding protein [Burkholderiales bacterium]|jgi:acyl-CoA synthetase (AMP-forming)/AMP-acid ligase II|nr:AMP-binding protein [Burkholderiales bacterium]